MFECVLMEKGIEKMKQCSVSEEQGEDVCLPSSSVWNPGKASSILFWVGVPGCVENIQQHMKYVSWNLEFACYHQNKPTSAHKLG